MPGDLGIINRPTGSDTKRIEDIIEDFDQLLAGVNALLTPNNKLDPAQIEGAKILDGGSSIIATEESRTNVAYGKLPTPDQVSGVVLPPNGLIVVVYQALWKSSVA